MVSLQAIHIFFPRLKILIASLLRTSLLANLNELLESTVDGRADVGDVLIELDGGNSTLADAFGGELKLLLGGQYHPFL